jgi:hypothetical protein
VGLLASDGLDDLIVGARYADPSGKSDAGRSYVVFGKANGSAINLSAIAEINNPTGGFVINGEVSRDNSGYSVSSAVKSKVRPAPSNLRVSTPPPPSTRARLPAPVCSNAVILLALMRMQRRWFG